jgi:hypothetical protein
MNVLEVYWRAARAALDLSLRLGQRWSGIDRHCDVVELPIVTVSTPFDEQNRRSRRRSARGTVTAARQLPSVPRTHRPKEGGLAFLADKDLLLGWSPGTRLAHGTERSVLEQTKGAW